MLPWSRLRAWLHFTTFLSAGLIALAAAPAPAQAQTNWTGATSSDWFTAGNWSAGVPTSAIATTIIDTVAPNATVVGTAGAQANNLVIGTLNGTGTLTIQNAGTVTNSNGLIAFAPGSTGTVTVDGTGSLWTIPSGSSSASWAAARW